MATYINNIFNFSRSLPSPFDTIANKKIKVSSKYGDGTTSTLCGTVIKAVHAVCHCMDGSRLRLLWEKKSPCYSRNAVWQLQAVKQRETIQK